MSNRHHTRFQFPVILHPSISNHSGLKGYTIYREFAQHYLHVSQNALLTHEPLSPCFTMKMLETYAFTM